MQETKQLYKKEGEMIGAVQAVIALIAGVGVSVLVLIFVGTLSGQTYSMVQADLTAINTTSPAAYGNVTSAILSGFTALKQTGSYLPIIVLAIVIAIVLALVLGMTGIASGGRGGSAL
jgi:hypothetical protein